MCLMAERPWGFWTKSKLDMLSEYLPAFTIASQRAPSTVYLDLFAGQAHNVSRDTGLPIEGSLPRALRTQPQFTVVRGFELRPAKARSLQALLLEKFPGRDVAVHAGDVHNQLGQALTALSAYRRCPTFAFIDPDGVEARWELLQALAAHKPEPATKVELFLLLVAPQIRRVVNDRLDETDLGRAEQQVTALFGSEEWRPILDGRRSGALDPERTRDELTNLMRWRLENTLRYKFTHTLRLTNIQGGPLYDMVFATDHPVGDKIMKSVYRKAARLFPDMRLEARARRQDRRDTKSGTEALFSAEEVLGDSSTGPDVTYQHTPPVPPYEQTSHR